MHYKCIISGSLWGYEVDGNMLFFMYNGDFGEFRGQKSADQCAQICQQDANCFGWELRVNDGNRCFTMDGPSRISKFYKVNCIINQVISWIIIKYFVSRQMAMLWDSVHVTQSMTNKSQKIQHSSGAAASKLSKR